MTDSNRGGFGFIKNRTLRNKLLIIVGIATLLFGSTLAFTFFRLNAEVDTLEDLLNNEVKLEEASLEMAIASDEMIISIMEYITLENEEARVEFDDAVLLLQYETEEIHNLLDQIGKEEADEIRVYIDTMETVVAEIVDFVNPEDTSTLGIFDLVDQSILEIETVSEEVELMSHELNDIYTLSENLNNTQEVDQLILELEVDIMEATIQAFLYQLDHRESEKQHVEYVYAINNSSAGLSLDILEYRQLHLILSDLIDAINLETDDSELLGTINNELDDVQTQLSVIKFQMIDLISIKDELMYEVETLEHDALTLENTVISLIALIDLHVEAENAKIDQERSETLIEILFVVVAIIVITTVVTFYIVRITVAPVHKLTAIANEMADGDLTGKIDFEYNQDEIGELTQSFERMVTQLKSVLSATSASVSIFNATSEDIFSSTEEINSSAEEVANTSQAMSDGATTQTKLIAEVNDDIEVVTSVMDEIIKKIQANTSDVAQIALQTNILALNAGIEASRAGDYGRGFMVVAENVRKLSDQSKTAAQQIDLVADEISDKLQTSFAKISNAIFNIVSVSEETAASAEEVAAAAEEMGATIEELTTTAQELTSQAEESAQMISEFKLE